MIEIINLTYQYPHAETPLFDSVNFHIPAGSLTLVSGPSGSGKSTLLRMINGLVPHFSGGRISGQIAVFGSNPIAVGPEKMAKKVGFVFQEPEAQFVYETVEDEIAFTLENLGLAYPEMHQRVMDTLKAFDLATLRMRSLHSLSGGEKQKVALACVMVSNPRVLLLDEPTSQLDPRSAERILDFILQLKSQYGLTVLISEHRLERMLSFIDYIVNIDASHKVLFGSPQEILPEMTQVPPIIDLGRKLKFSPLPLRVEEFPKELADRSPHQGLQPEKMTYKNPALIELRNFSVHIAGQKVLDQINLEIKAAEILTILGPNGAGKTTLLRALLGLVPSSGQRTLAGDDLRATNLPDLIKTIAYLPQNPNDLLFAETVLEELKTTLNNHNLKRSEEELLDFLGFFGLEPMKNRFPRDLSVGERQRTALAAITVHDPRVILLDEPTRGMDYDAKDQLASLTKTWRDAGKAILLVTHDVELAAMLSDRTVILKTGHIQFDGSPQIAFTQFPDFQTQMAKLFPGTGWITPDDVVVP